MNDKEAENIIKNRDQLAAVINNLLSIIDTERAGRELHPAQMGLEKKYRQWSDKQFRESCEKAYKEGYNSTYDNYSWKNIIYNPLTFIILFVFSLMFGPQTAITVLGIGTAWMLILFYSGTIGNLK